MGPKSEEYENSDRKRLHRPYDVYFALSTAPYLTRQRTCAAVCRLTVGIELPLTSSTSR